MTTQVIFKMDRKLKERAMKKARQEGVPFSVVLKLATEAFVEGALNISLTGSEKFNQRTRKEISKALKDTEANRNLSPKYKTTSEAIAALNS